MILYKLNKKMALTIKFNSNYEYLNSKYNLNIKKQKIPCNFTKKLTIDLKKTFDNIKLEQSEYLKDILDFINNINSKTFFDLSFGEILKILFTDEISNISQKNYLNNINNYLNYQKLKVNINNNNKNYFINKYLGKGSYSLVFQIKDNDDNDYAIKIFNSNFNNKFFKKEINFLKKLNNYNSFINCICHDNTKHFKYVVMEKIKYNLYQFVINNTYNHIPLKLVLNFMKSLLNCLKILKNEKIIHTDIKLENIMINSCDINQIIENNIQIKLIDFSLSIDKEEKETNTITYLQSRYYRSIEVATRYKYDYPMDIWSVGCVLFELYTKNPLFPSDDELDHFKMITETFGMPPKYMIESFKLYFEEIKINKIRQNKYDMYYKIIDYIHNFNNYNVINSYQKIIKYKILKLVSNKEEINSKEFDNFCCIISKMFKLNPYERINIEEAITSFNKFDLKN